MSSKCPVKQRVLLRKLDEFQCCSVPYETLEPFHSFNRTSPFAGLISSGQFFEAIAFAMKFPECLVNILVLSVVSVQKTALTSECESSNESWLLDYG